MASHAYNTRFRARAEASAQNRQTDESSTEERLLIDMTPAELNRSLQNGQIDADRAGTTDEERFYGSMLSPTVAISTPARHARRTNRTRRQTANSAPAVSEPVAEPAQQHSDATMLAMKSMVEQVAVTMRAMQNMIEVTAETLKRVNNQSQTPSCPSPKASSTIDVNNSKSGPRNEEPSDKFDDDFTPVRARGVKSRMCPPYPQRDRKRRLNGAVCRNHRIKRVVPCRCYDGHVKEPYEMSMALGNPTVGPTSSSVRLHIYVPSHI